MSKGKPRFPEVEVRLYLEGEDGNAFWILGKVTQELRDLGVSADVVSQFVAQATARDYDHLLETVRSWVSVVVVDERAYAETYDLAQRVLRW